MSMGVSKRLRLPRCNYDRRRPLLMFLSLLCMSHSVTAWSLFKPSRSIRYSSRRCNTDHICLSASAPSQWPDTWTTTTNNMPPDTPTGTGSAQEDKSYYQFLDVQKASSSRITLARYLNMVVKEKPELRHLESLYQAVQMACKTISNLVHRYVQFVVF